MAKKTETVKKEPKKTAPKVAEPKAEIISDVCIECKGSGRDTQDNKCVCCEGTGKRL